MATPSSIAMNSSIESDTQRLQECRLEKGQCPQCGTQLYKRKEKPRWRLLKSTSSSRFQKPLTIQGVVDRGQCVPCSYSPNDHVASDLMYALALSAEIEQDNSPHENHAHELHHPPAEIPAPPFATIVEIPPVSTLHAPSLPFTYFGDSNEYGERHGQGVLTWSNGDCYAGEFYDNQRHGHGTLTFRQGEYVGDWKHNQMDGNGTRRYSNGNVYSGSYLKGKRHGEGKCYFANGDLFHGEWNTDYMNGYGRYYYNNGHAYEGMFWKGARHGVGKYQYPDGRLDIHTYQQDLKVGEGVRWSNDRKKAWHLVDGVMKGRVSLERAANIVLSLEQRV